MVTAIKSMQRSPEILTLLLQILFKAHAAIESTRPSTSLQPRSLGYRVARNGEILFSDETHLHPGGYASKQNYHIIFLFENVARNVVLLKNKRCRGMNNNFFL